MLKRTLLTAITAVVLASSASAAVMVDQNFNALETGAIDGQVGWSDPNGTGEVIEGGLSYQVESGGLIYSEADGVRKRILLDGTEQASLDIPALGQTTYIRFLAMATAEETQNNEMFMRLPGWDTYLALKWHSGGLMEGRLDGGAQPTIPETLAADEVHLVVGKLTADGDNFVRLDMWLNPAYGDEAAPEASVTGSIAMADLTEMGLRTQNLPVSVDEIKFATSWDEVVPVPEPATMAVLGLGGVAVLIRRKR